MSLLTALKSSNERLVETICASGASANDLEDGASPMHIVVGLHQNNAKQLTKILLQYGGDPNVENEEKLTPIHVSVIRGNFKILHLLLRNGGDPTKKDEEGRDAWDYALKYGRSDCQRILLDYMDEDTLAGSDEEQDRYVSIFFQDIPITSHRDLSRFSSNSSELDRGFVRSSYGSVRTSTNPSPLSDQQPVTCQEQYQNTSIDNATNYYRPRKDTPPRPPPRRSRSYKSIDTVDGHRCGCNPPIISPTNNQRPDPKCQKTIEGSRTESKPSKNILSVIRKTLSPSAKSESKVRVDKPNYDTRQSTKSKSRSPLASLLRSPSKSAKLTRMKSCASSPNTVRFDIDGNSKFSRSQSVPSDTRYSVSGRLSDRDRQLLEGAVPTSIDATSPDNCLVTVPRSTSPRKRLNMEIVSKPDQKYSPSNYSHTSCKPEKDKTLESPFRLKHRRKSLFKRLLGSSPTSLQGNGDSVNIGIGQTVKLSERRCADSVSQLSIEIPPKSETRSSSAECSHCNSITSLPTPKIINSKEMEAIEASRKAFDDTNSNNCRILDVDTSRSVSLDRTVCYKSPPPKPQRLYLTQEFTVHQPATGDHHSAVSTHCDNALLRYVSRDNNQSEGGSKGTTPDSEAPAHIPTPPELPTRLSGTQVSEAKPGPPERPMRPKLERLKELHASWDKSDDGPVTNQPSTSRAAPADMLALRGSLTAELEQAFKAMQLRMKNTNEETPKVCETLPEIHKAPEVLVHKPVTVKKPFRTREIAVASPVCIKSVCEAKEAVTTRDMGSGQLNHRWTSKGRSKLMREKSVVSDTYDVVDSADLCTVKSTANEYSAANVRPSFSKDSGIESNMTSQTRGQRHASGSEDSFHTCQSGSVALLHGPLSEKPLGSLPDLPTEIDSLQAKVSRMNLEEFNPVGSDNESNSPEELDYSKCVTILPSSICASDGSIAEYLHTDLETNVTLTEARWPVTCTVTSNSKQSIDWRTFSELSICSDDNKSVSPVSIPRDILYLSDNELVRDLVELGDVPGPITSATRRVYQLRLLKLRDNPQLCTPNKACGFSRELQQFASLHPSVSLDEINQWEHELVAQFEASSGRKWREGNSKMSFTYLLLDPRTTKNLPARHHLLDSEENGNAFRVFLSAVFYVGKGKKTRPYQHFIDAIRKKNDSEKTSQILDIWRSGLGVVSLHVFHNILPVEAYTREACMVDAIGLKNLTNVAKCSYYGVASTWSSRRKRLVGADLLRKAYSILLIEGERQIRPADVRDESELPSFLV